VAELTPEQLLALLYTEPRRLDLTEDERAALARPASPVAWTAADVPLLDELAELLGDTDAAERAGGQRRAEQEAERAEAIQYATQVVDDLRQAGAIARPDVGVRRGAGWPGRHDKYVDPPD